MAEETTTVDGSREAASDLPLFNKLLAEQDSLRLDNVGEHAQNIVNTLLDAMNTKQDLAALLFGAEKAAEMTKAQEVKTFFGTKLHEGVILLEAIKQTKEKFSLPDDCKLEFKLTITF
jgi:hypothetical protein